MEVKKVIKEQPVVRTQEGIEKLTPRGQEIVRNLKNLMAELWEAEELNWQEEGKGKEWQSYRRQFDQEFADFERAADAEELRQALEKAEVILVGDYHSLRKSQEFMTELLKRFSQSDQKKEILALEFIEMNRQKDLESFLDGKISEEVFLKKIKFSQWTNPEHWPSYRQEIMMARQRRIKVKAAGRQGADFRINLTQRDRKLAQDLEQWREDEKAERFWVQIGDRHLAAPFLPRELKKKLGMAPEKMVRLAQNLPTIYFQALTRFPDFKLPFLLKIAPQTFHLFNVPLLTRLVADLEAKIYFEEGEENFYETWAEIWGADLAPRFYRRWRQVLNLSAEEIPGEERITEEFYPGFIWNEEAENFLNQKLWPEKVKKFYQSILREKGCVFITEPSREGEQEWNGEYLLIKRFRLKRILEELARGLFFKEKSEDDQETEPWLYLFSKIFIPERQPQNKIEEKGEQLFQRFLRGEDIGLARVVDKF